MSRKKSRICAANTALDKRRDFGPINPDILQRSTWTAARRSTPPDQFRGEKLSIIALILPMLAIGAIHVTFFSPYGGFASWSEYANAGPLRIPLPIRKPLPKLADALPYPPILRVPPASPYASLIPLIPVHAPQRRKTTLRLKDQRYPLALTLPERALPPLPPMAIAMQYPPKLSLPPTPALALIIPPIPGRYIAPADARLNVARVGYPARLAIRERLLPPLPKLARGVQYPARLALPPVPPLALITPPLPPRIKRAPVPKLQLARLAFPPSLVLPDRLLPPSSAFNLARGYLPAGGVPRGIGSGAKRLRRSAGVKTTASRTTTGKAMAMASKNKTGKTTDNKAAANRRGKEGTDNTKSTYSVDSAPKNQSIAALQKRSSWPISIAAPPPKLSFALRLVAAVRAQMDNLTIYNADYVSLSYPMGDVPATYGVCSDVIVRAYRKLGLDLQELVYRARIGSGDTNIDHRRTQVLRKFFKRYGKSLPITSYAEDYLPGDMVSYYRPFGISSKFHIAVVSERFAPSGRPYVLHNRAWGVQEEDALFSDKITGHYRFSADMLYPKGRAPSKAQLMATISLPRRAPPRSVARRKPAALVAWTTVTVPAKPALPTPATLLADAGKLSLCSPLQPARVKARMAQFCSSSGRKAMALGGPQPTR